MQPDRRQVPAVEIAERNDEILVTVELPGLAAEDVKVEVIGGVLIVQGERRPERGPETPREYRRRRRYFYREIVLPNGLDTNQARAEMSNGVLRIHIPFKPQQVRRMPIQSKSA